MRAFAPKLYLRFCNFEKISQMVFDLFQLTLDINYNSIENLF